MSGAWIGVDLDGTLAKYTPGDWHTIGDPIEPMIQRVARWLNEGMQVRILTARVSEPNVTRYALERKIDRQQAKREIEAPIHDWCMKHLGVTLPLTAEKDGWMLELYDDRAVQVEFNTGLIIGQEQAMEYTETELYMALRKALDRLAFHDPIADRWELPEHSVHDVVTIIKEALQ